MNRTPDDASDDYAVDIRVILFYMLAKRWWIAGTTLAFALIFAVAAFLMTPVYRASIVLVPASAERNSLGSSLSSALNQFGGLAAMAGISLSGGDTATEEALAVLQSREFTENFIRDKHLLPKLFAGRRLDRGEENRADATGDLPSMAKAYAYFDKNIRKVVRDKQTGLIRLQIDWIDAEEAAAWANELVERLNAEMRNRAMAHVGASIGFLEKELETTSIVETRQAINRLIEAQVKQRMLASVTQEYAFRVAGKALPPDRDDPVKPNKPLMITLGAVLGFTCASLWFFFSTALRLEARIRSEASSK